MDAPLVTLACHATCEACTLQLTRGNRAWLVGKRAVRCETCGPAAVALVAAAPPRVGPEVRTASRFFATIGVALKSAARLAWDRLRGKRRTGPVVVRRALEELGPTYTKLGQLVASTQGIFPEGYCLELRGCLDRVRPVRFDAIERVVAAELGVPLAQIFSDIESSPLASASIAQVHAARLRDGSDVVLKVQRPGIGESIAADVRLLRGLARVVGKTPRGALASPEAIVDDFAKTLFEELDFTREAENMTEFNRAMKDLDRADVAAPRVVQATRRLIVMERFHGTRVDEVDAETLGDEAVEEKLVAGMRAWFQCVVFHGFFHGDVHAGNLMALADGRIGFLDWGITGRLTPAQRRGVIDTLLCFAGGDFRKLARVWRAMGTVEGHVDLDRLAADLAEVYAPLLESTAESMKFADMLPALIRASEKHRLKLPRDFVLVTKQMLYFDRYAKKLAPRLNVFKDPRLVTPLAMDVLAAQMLAG
jgi:predicted unusual protein kinase regulating ubiquinone biosynthesis (AarF/ABC1/UbiB family)